MQFPQDFNRQEFISTSKQKALGKMKVGRRIQWKNCMFSEEILVYLFFSQIISENFLTFGVSEKNSQILMNFIVY